MSLLAPPAQELERPSPFPGRHSSPAPISVAIPAFGNEQALAHTLRQIACCVPLPAEVLLHYDGGWEPTLDMASLIPVPVTILRSDHCIGPGGGRDRLLRAANQEFIASFDDDSWPLDTDYFARAVALMESIPNAAVISPAVYLAERPAHPNVPEINSVRAFEGSASIHRRSIHFCLPGYVPVPAAYGVEEVDLALQIHAAGYEMYSTPWLRAWHDRPLVELNHTVLPWIRNELLLAYLRFPTIAQPWGLVRALRHVMRNLKTFPPLVLWRELGRSLAHCAEYRSYKRRYSLAEVWRHHRHQSRRFRIEVQDDPPSCYKLLIKPAPRAPVLLSIQYGNPGAYPPLEHMSHILFRHGWEVQFLGIGGYGGVNIDFAPHPRVKVERLAHCPPGLRQKLHYLRFALWCLWRAWRIKLDWLYASDALSAPIALLLARRLKCRVLYHEHDCPVSDGAQEKGFQRLVRRERIRLAKMADVVVVPNEMRLRHFVLQTGRTGLNLCVWNCPALEEIAPPNEETHEETTARPLRLIYHGSIVPDRFPMTFIEALAVTGPDVEIRLIGYETNGSQGYTTQLMERARQLGVADRFHFYGPMCHHQILKASRECHVGLAMLRIHDGDINMQHMVGASNKPFDYLSQGLALIVSSDPKWEALFVDAGCALSCPMHDIQKLAATFRWMADHRQEVREMGQRGKTLIAQEWNYERQFAPVLSQLQSQSGLNSRHEPFGVTERLCV
jgi:glycosyltransferase involved in cell wall biosynthesis